PYSRREHPISEPRRPPRQHGQVCDLESLATQYSRRRATSQSSSASPETTLDLEKSDVPSARLTGSNHPPGPSPRHHNHRLLERCDSLSRVSPPPCRRIVLFHSSRQPERQR